MDENLSFSPNEVLREAVTRMQEDGAFDRDAYNDLVDEIIEHKIERGELDVDEDTEEIKEQLRMRWSEAEAMLTTGHETDILDQE